MELIKKLFGDNGEPATGPGPVWVDVPLDGAQDFAAKNTAVSTTPTQFATMGLWARVGPNRLAFTSINTCSSPKGRTSP